jgi:hypothetical protein
MTRAAVWTLKENEENGRNNAAESQTPSSKRAIVIPSGAKDLWSFFSAPNAISRDVSLRST